MGALKNKSEFLNIKVENSKINVEIHNIKVENSNIKLEFLNIKVEILNIKLEFLNIKVEFSGMNLCRKLCETLQSIVNETVRKTV